VLGGAGLSEMFGIDLMKTAPFHSRPREAACKAEARGICVCASASRVGGGQGRTGCKARAR